MNRWTDGQVEQTDRWKNRQTKRWTNEETDRQRDGQTVGQTNRWADKRQTEIAQRQRVSGKLGKRQIFLFLTSETPILCFMKEMKILPLIIS